MIFWRLRPVQWQVQIWHMTMVTPAVLPMSCVRCGSLWSFVIFYHSRPTVQLALYNFLHMSVCQRFIIPMEKSNNNYYTMLVLLLSCTYNFELQSIYYFEERVLQTVLASMISNRQFFISKSLTSCVKKKKFNVKQVKIGFEARAWGRILVFCVDAVPLALVVIIRSQNNGQRMESYARNISTGKGSIFPQ